MMNIAGKRMPPADDPEALDERFRGLKPALEAAIRDDAALL